MRGCGDGMALHSEARPPFLLFVSVDSPKMECRADTPNALIWRASTIIVARLEKDLVSRRKCFFIQKETFSSEEKKKVFLRLKKRVAMTPEKSFSLRRKSTIVIPKQGNIDQKCPKFKCAFSLHFLILLFFQRKM
jgi:hypothetical protein